MDVDTLPDDVLAAILKLVADLPVASHGRAKPFPIAATRVSRRWRALTLDLPELWTNIRISHHSRSWKLAAVFVRRSGSYPRFLCRQTGPPCATQLNHVEQGVGHCRSTYRTLAQDRAACMRESTA
ncbi:hypothetical protein B0H10DRAFT_2207944 [Mycena sp. CBHHK59/15]|nr:hypothetical protein B0H10DRAFT_2207944 [Mycena sp. CBHHK59/15]